MFSVYFKLGLHHISDLSAYDHILFIVAIATRYSLADYKKLFVMVTAFTIGHSLTLALAVYNVITIPSALIEFLIPVTIFFAALSNLFSGKNTLNDTTKYIFILLFGLIHGMGFSNFLSYTLGQKQGIGLPLLAFNCGLEIGQLAILAVYLFIQTIFFTLLRIKKLHWQYSLAAITIVFSIYLMYKTKF